MCHVTLNDLFAMEPEATSHELCYLYGFSYNFVDHPCGWRLSSESDERVEIRIIHETYFDHRRMWRLATVWFDGKPVMAIQNAGRSGDDYYAKFVADKDLYLALCRYLRETYRDEGADEVEDVVAPTTDLGDRLDTFYHCTLEGLRTKALRAVTTEGK